MTTLVLIAEIMDSKIDLKFIDCLKNDIVKQVMCATPLTTINLEVILKFIYKL